MCFLHLSKISTFFKVGLEYFYRIIPMNILIKKWGNYHTNNVNLNEELIKDILNRLDVLESKTNS